MVFKLGRYGGYVLVYNKGEKYLCVFVGCDIRVLGEMLELVLIVGLILIGVEVMWLGIILILGVVYLICDMGVELGVMILVFYNLVVDNGIKFFGSDGFKLLDE